MHFLPNEQGETFKINLYDHGCGLAVADFDGDGHDDIYFCNQLGPNALYRNKGDGTFEDVAAAAGVALGDRVCVGATFADYDNDGRPDLYVTSTRGGNVLFHNEGGGRFKDVTEQAGLTHVGHSQTAVFFDYDNDSFLDLFVTNTAAWTTDTYDPPSRHFLGKGVFREFTNSPKEHNRLYRNNGDGTFTDVTRKAGLRGLGWAGDAAAFDYDGDGWIDLYVTNMFGRNQLYRNDGNGQLAEISDKAGLETFWPWGIATGDFDNDGHEDVFVPSGMGYPFYYWPNALLMNQGDGTFRDRAAEMGIEPVPRGPLFPQPMAGRPAARSSRCAVAGDFDGDGRLEVVTNNFNDQPYYFKSRFPQKHYVAFRLRGTQSNRDAVGAVVRLYRGGQVLTRQVHGAGGYLSQATKTVHFGLGDRPDIDRVEIIWPSGLRQRLGAVAADALHDIGEPPGQPSTR
jgi:hypothetical protein